MASELYTSDAAFVDLVSALYTSDTVFVAIAKEC